MHQPTPEPVRTAVRAPERLVTGVLYTAFAVGNLRQSAHYLGLFGFREYASGRDGDLETWAGSCGSARVRLLAGRTGAAPLNELVRQRGDGVFEIAFQVTSTESVYERALAAGFAPAREPGVVTDSDGSGRRAVVTEPASGLRLALIEGTPDAAVGDASLEYLGVDHFVVCVPSGQMHDTAGRLRKAFGFVPQHDYSDGRIATGASQFRSVIVWGGHGSVHVTVTEPAPDQPRSQIAVFLDAFGGGVQHVALAVDDVVAWVRLLRARGVGFLEVPDTYYEGLPARVPAVAGIVDDLRACRVLADQERDGYLLQIFTDTLSHRPTFFFELIERHGATGFGEGNIQALYEAVEADHRRRGLA